MKREGIIVILLILVALSPLCGCDRGNVNNRFSLSVENKTSALLHEVAFNMTPEGDFEFGVLSPEANASFQDPPWKEINTIHLSFKDDAGTRFDFDLKVEVPDRFRGEIRVQIAETQDKKSASIILIPK